MSGKRPKGWGVKAAQISKWLATEEVGGGERMKVGHMESKKKVVTSNKDLSTLVNVNPAPLVFVFVSET